MVEDGVDVGWEHALIGIVHLHGGVRPPKEGLRHIGAVVQPTFDFEIGTAGTQREPCHSLLMEHLFHFAHPYADRTIGVLLNAGVNRHEGRGAVMLRPVELDAARYPRTCKSYKGRFDDVIVIDEMTLCYLVVCHLHPTAQFGQHHHLDILVLQPDGEVLLVDFLIRHRLNDGIGIDHTTASLIDSFLQKHRVFLWFPHLVCGNSHQFSPSFYHFLF